MNITLNKILRTSLGVILGIYGTYFLVQQDLLSPVLASAFSGLIASLIFKNATDLIAAIYCGSFAGMGLVLTGTELIVTSILEILLLLILQPIFKGFGGKLGLIAYISSIVTDSILSQFWSGFSVLKHFETFYPITDFNLIISVVLASFLGFYSTIYFYHRKKKTAVFASAFPSFLAGLLCYYTNLPNGDLIALTFFSASFVGMLSENVIQKNLYWILVSIHALIFLVFKNSLGNYGGALGTIAFVSVYSVAKIASIFYRKDF